MEPDLIWPVTTLCNFPRLGSTVTPNPSISTEAIHVWDVQTKIDKEKDIGIGGAWRKGNEK